MERKQEGKSEVESVGRQESGGRARPGSTRTTNDITDAASRKVNLLRDSFLRPFASSPASFPSPPCTPIDMLFPPLTPLAVQVPRLIVCKHGIGWNCSDFAAHDLKTALLVGKRETRRPSLPPCGRLWLLQELAAIGYVHDYLDERMSFLICQRAACDVSGASSS